MSEQVVHNSTAEKKPFVRMRNATQKFAGVTALYALDWDIVPGEVHCLMGENGCGKSTAIKILSGVNIPEPETIIEIDGKEYSRLTPAQSKALGLHVIYQDLSLFPNLTVAENIALVLDEPFDLPALAKRVREVSEHYGLPLDPNQHQAMLEIPSDKTPGTIVQEMQAGYMLKDRLLRPAMVGVAKAG